MVSTHLKNICQNGNLPQIGVKIKNLWNHHLDLIGNFHRKPCAPCLKATNHPSPVSGPGLLQKPPADPRFTGLEAAFQQYRLSINGWESGSFIKVGSVANRPSPNWQEKYHLYTTYILPSRGLYNPYHPLQEPEKSAEFTRFFIKTYIHRFIHKNIPCRTWGLICYLPIPPW